MVELQPGGDGDGISSAQADEMMYVDVGSYEGPLDLLLELARKQKVDLTAISVLALAEQYLAFIQSLRDKRIEVAADYLVMAAWLAYLKSRLMVPRAPSDDEPSGEMMAALLQFRLKRLEAMRRSAASLVARPQLGRDIMARGMPEPLVVDARHQWTATLYDMLSAYAGLKQRQHVPDYTPAPRKVWSLQDARDALQRLVGESFDWLPMDAYLARFLAIPEERASVRASAFSASLELVRQGHVELRQTSVFAPLLVRRRRKDDRP